MTNPNEQKTVFTVTEAANHLGLAVSTLNKWRCLGGGPQYLKLGKAVRYRRTDLDTYLDRRNVTSTSQYGKLV